jgi:GNAT superfamily N-acetyltransferase
VLIRAARTEDATPACQVLRRSVTELCYADHGGDSAVLEKWLANKTPESVASWIAHDDNYVFIAEQDGEIVGVAAVTGRGEILLNYVSPDARFRGVSKALLQQMEATARELGNATCTLTSTVTAQHFYLSAGYVVHAASGFGPGVMVKRLANG